MPRPTSLATLVLALAACSPEVELARHEPVGGGAGAAPVGGSGGVPSGGSGGQVLEAGAGEGGEPTLPPEARILADSVADFSLTQGDHGWYYGSDSGDVADFKPLGLTDVIKDFMPPSKDMWECWRSETTHWTQIFRLGAHPNG